MNKENSKRNTFMLISIIVLLIAFLPVTLYVSVLKINKKIEESAQDNPHHKLYFEGSLYFYSTNDKLLGTYSCQYQNCNYAINTSDDSNYSLNYDKNNYNYNNSFIENRYVFVNDNYNNYDNAILYDIDTKKVLETFKAKKDYFLGIDNNLIIVQNNNNLWGVIQIKDGTYKVVVPFNYEFIGLQNKINEASNKIEVSSFVVRKDTKWALVSNEGLLLTKYIPDEIISYNSKYIYARLGDYYDVYNYEGISFNNSYKYKHINIKDNLIEYVTIDNKIFVYDINQEKVLSEVLKLKSYNTENVLHPPYEILIDQNKLIIKIYEDQQYGNFKTYEYEINK